MGLTVALATAALTLTSIAADHKSEVDLSKLPPAATKANLRLRSDNGDVYSDFDVQLAPSASPAVEPSNSSNGRYRIRRNRSVVGAINGGGPEFELRTFNSNVYVRKGK